MSSSQQTADIVLIHQIAARANVNKEIIARINGADMEKSVKYSISSFLDDSSVAYHPNRAKAAGIHLNTSTRSPHDLIESLEVVMLDIEDFFNDKLDYKVQKFSDLERLNAAMVPIAKKYELFGPTPKALEVLRSFKSNFDTIHVALGKVEEMCVARQKKRKEILDGVKMLNKRYEELVEEVAKMSTALRNKQF